MTVRSFAKKHKLTLPKDLDKRVMKLHVGVGFSPKFLGLFFHAHPNHIWINGMILVFGTKEDLQLVFNHEVAHAINHFQDKNRKPHGREWKMIAKRLGIKNPTKISYVSEYLIEVLWSNE